MIETVFLDMDGVLVDFLAGLHRALDVPYSIDQHPYEKGKWNVLCDIKQGSEQIPTTFKQCNDLCVSDFWANLEWTPDGIEIYELVRRKFGAENIYLLTTCMPNVGTAPGKMRWLKCYMPNFISRTIIIGSGVSKGLFASPDALLIDDRDKNVEEFTNAGGRGLLVPRPWNADYGMANHTVEVVHDRLEDHLCQES